MMQEIEIRLAGQEISRIAGGPLSGVLRLLEGEKEIFIVCDRQVEPVGKRLMEACGGVVGMMPIVASEEEKDMDTVLDICGRMMDAGLSRGALLLAVGGGITTDLSGFAASVYKRGIRYANIPTTLLAQVDAGIGGKTGVNFESYKNMIGVIRQPVFTYLCAEVLETLPKRDFLSGAAELLKTFLIDNTSGNYEKASSQLAAQLMNEPTVPQTVITDDYIFTKGNGVVTDLSTIRWIFRRIQRYNFVKVGEYLIGKDSFGKEKILMTYGKNTDPALADRIIEAVRAKVPDLLIGYDRENMKAYNEYRKQVKNGNIPA